METEGNSEFTAVRLDIRLEKAEYCDLFGVHPDDFHDDLTNAVAEEVYQWLGQTGHRDIGVAGTAQHSDWQIDARGQIKTWVEDQKVWMTVGNITDYES